MFQKLNQLIPQLPELLKNEDAWDSLIINKREPHTYRIFRQFNGNRVCLHKFTPCHKEEAFLHPHAWPAAFLILDGSYKMELGFSTSPYFKAENTNIFILNKGSKYEMCHPYCFHSVSPLVDTYTVMINGPDYPYKHDMCRTTKGKDLEKLDDKTKSEYLFHFRQLVQDYLEI